MMKLVLLCLALVALASSANAFPLSGSNGIVNATVFGMYKPLDDVIVLDISCSEYLLSENVVLVDADDKFYEAEDVSQGRVGLSGYYDVIDRTLYAFEGIPPQTEIKRVKITPGEGDPFSIEWTGVPEVKGIPISMKFYGLEIKSDYGSPDYQNPIQLDTWMADVKITNTGNDTLEFKRIDFAFIDQFGYSYDARDTTGETVKLLPAESMRTKIGRGGWADGGFSKLSRPVYMVYKPSNLRMDISAWA